MRAASASRKSLPLHLSFHSTNLVSITYLSLNFKVCERSVCSQLVAAELSPFWLMSRQMQQQHHQLGLNCLARACLQRTGSSHRSSEIRAARTMHSHSLPFCPQIANCISGRPNCSFSGHSPKRLGAAQQTLKVGAAKLIKDLNFSPLRHFLNCSWH